MLGIPYLLNVDISVTLFCVWLHCMIAPAYSPGRLCGSSRRLRSVAATSRRRRRHISPVIQPSASRSADLGCSDDYERGSKIRLLLDASWVAEARRRRRGGDQKQGCSGGGGWWAERSPAARAASEVALAG